MPLPCILKINSIFLQNETSFSGVVRYFSPDDLTERNPAESARAVKTKNNNNPNERKKKKKNITNTKRGQAQRAYHEHVFPDGPGGVRAKEN